MARLLTLYEEGEKKEYRGGGYKGGGLEWVKTAKILANLISPSRLYKS